MEYMTAVVGVVEYNGQILIARKKRADHFLSEEWHIPGGKVRDGETENDAVKREIYEESGIRVDVLRFLDEKIDETSKFRVRWYLCSPLTHKLAAGDDVDEVKYVAKSEVESSCGANAVSLWPEKVVDYLLI